MKQQIEFKAEYEDEEAIPWAGNIEQAFNEFFLAKAQQTGSKELSARLHEETDKFDDYPDKDPMIGDSKENAFKASNGIKIWWE